MRFLAPLLLALLLPGAGAAAQSRLPEPRPPEPRPMEPPPARVGLSYATYVAGLRVHEVSADVALGPAGYRIDLSARTAGTYGLLFRGETRTLAQGRWAGQFAAPQRFAVAGHWRGTPRRTLIEYAGGLPQVLRLQPPNETEREPVAPALQAETIDSLSAAALLVRRIAATGGCEGEARTYDGRRLSEIAVATAGWEELAPDDRSGFAGRALRCDFAGRLLAGFMLDGDRAAAARPQTGTAWFAAPLPDAPLLPVRLRFDMRWLGSATMYLTAAAAGGAPMVRVRADAELGAPPLALP